MGIITKRFLEVLFTNEASVEQNFVIPLLTEILGYSRSNIHPKELYKVPEKFPINRDQALSFDALKRGGNHRFHNNR